MVLFIIFIISNDTGIYTAPVHFKNFLTTGRCRNLIPCTKSESNFVRLIEQKTKSYSIVSITFDINSHRVPSVLFLISKGCFNYLPTVEKGGKGGGRCFVACACTSRVAPRGGRPRRTLPIHIRKMTNNV